VKFGSVCSGIEAASVAWHPLGWQASWFAEIEPFPCAVLAHHYPDVPNLGDMTTIAKRVLTGEVEAPDVLAGGTPCQAFSVAGLRESLADERGNLTLKFVELADAIDFVRTRDGRLPAIVFWENVPGVLSTKDNAFGCFLAGLAGEDEPLRAPGGKWANAGAVYGPARAVAWRTLDAQYFGLAQRRRRVFVVGSAREGFDPATVLFEWEGVRRDSAPSREAREGSAGRAARSVALRGREGGGTAELGDELQNCLRAACGGGDKPHVLAPLAFGGNNTAGPIDVATARNAYASASGRMDFETETFLVQPARPVGFNARQDPDHWHDRTGPLDTDGSTQAVSYAIQAGALRTNPASGPDGVGVQADHAYTLEARAEVQAVAFVENSRAEVRLEGSDGSRCVAISTGGGKPGQGVPMIAHTMQVRRLTPRECERLQGFPDDYTRIPWKLGYWPADKHSADVRDAIAEQCPDGPRYKALGNSWAVPVVRWIGQRIQEAA
jgi:DNA (cytosine-5)-methyltransferase 1